MSKNTALMNSKVDLNIVFHGRNVVDIINRKVDGRDFTQDELLAVKQWECETFIPALLKEAKENEQLCIKNNGKIDGNL